MRHVFWLVAAISGLGAQSVLASPSADVQGLVTTIEANVCTEGECGDFDILRKAVDELAPMYPPVTDDVGVLSPENVPVYRALAEGNFVLSGLDGEADRVLDACKYGYLAIRSGEFSEDDVNLMASTCYKKRAPEGQRDEVAKLAVETWRYAADRAAQLSHPEANRLRFIYGDMLCRNRSPGECRQGLREMYEAALAEYQRQGVDGFDEELANLTSALNNAAIRFKDPQVYRFVAELQMALVDAGRLRIGGHQVTAEFIQAKLDQWAAEGVANATATTPLTSVTDGVEQSSPPAPQLPEDRPDRPEPQKQAPEAAQPEPTDRGEGAARPWAVAVVILLLAVAAIILGRRRRNKSTD